MTFKVELKSDPLIKNKVAMGIIIDGTLVYSCVLSTEQEWIPAMLSRVYTKGLHDGRMEAPHGF